MVAAQPATVPISVFGASRVSTVTLSLRFDPKVLRVRLVQEGTFLASGGGTVTFAQQVDAVSGRVDITVTRAGDAAGVVGRWRRRLGGVRRGRVGHLAPGPGRAW